MTINNIRWAASVLSVRGSFKINKNSVYICFVQNLHKDIVQLFYNYFGGHKHKYKHQHIWHLRGDPAVGLMMSMYDLMPQRRQKEIKKCVNVWKKTPIRTYKK